MVYYVLIVIFLISIGSSIAKTATGKNEHKESTKYFKNAMFVFNLIKGAKEEVFKNIPEKEILIDLLPEHLDYYITLSEIKGQLEIYKNAKETNPKEFLFHSKLAYSLLNLYKKARSLCNGPKKKLELKIILFNILKIEYIFIKV